MKKKKNELAWKTEKSDTDSSSVTRYVKWRISLDVLGLQYASLKIMGLNDIISKVNL